MVKGLEEIGCFLRLPPSLPLTYREKPYIIGFMSFSFHAKLMRNHRNRVSYAKPHAKPHAKQRGKET